MTFPKAGRIILEKIWSTTFFLQDGKMDDEEVQSIFFHMDGS
jgi:hypothetical protein